MLGVGDYAYTTVNKAVTDARTRAEKRAEEVQTRVSELPNEISELRTRLSSDHLRKQVDEFRDQAETVYAGFAKRGEKAWGRIRKQPQVKQAISTVEAVHREVRRPRRRVRGHHPRRRREGAEHRDPRDPLAG